jgi:hypothetical protein
MDIFVCETIYLLGFNLALDSAAFIGGNSHSTSSSNTNRNSSQCDGITCHNRLQQRNTPTILENKIRKDTNTAQHSRSGCRAGNKAFQWISGDILFKVNRSPTNAVCLCECRIATSKDVRRKYPCTYVKIVRRRYVGCELVYVCVVRPLGCVLILVVPAGNIGGYLEGECGNGTGTGWN